MTILEKIKFEEDWLSEVNLTKENIKIAFDGIRATVLEQQPCEDCISREAVEKLKKYRLSYDTNTTIPKTDIFVKMVDIKELPSVTPKSCEDTISRQAVDELSKNLIPITRGKDDFLCKFWEGLRKMPPVTPQTKTGHWLIDIKDSDYCICSECKDRFDVDHLKFSWDKYAFPPHCPNCGSYNGGEEDGSD